MFQWREDKGLDVKSCQMTKYNVWPDSECHINPNKRDQSWKMQSQMRGTELAPDSRLEFAFPGITLSSAELRAITSARSEETIVA